MKPHTNLNYGGNCKQALRFNVLCRRVPER